MINPKYVYAVVGASNNEEKYGYKVFKDLLEGWYNVVPVNPTEKEILGQEVYPTLWDIPEQVDVAIFVTQPAVTEKVLEQVKASNIKNVWMQPWAESDVAIDFCEKNGIECVHDACIMIQRKSKNI